MARMNIVKLKDVTNIITGYPFKSTLYTDHMPAVRLLRGDNIVQGRVRWENVKLYPTDEIKDLSDYELAIDDVVIAMDRPWIEAGLKHAQINKNDTPAYLVQRVARLRAKKIINKQYLKYIIGSSNFANYIVGAQTGTAIPHISKQIISNYEFELPPIEVQDKISSLVQLFDKKIELNRQMNETLEQMAQAVFQDWFVDFGPVKRKAKGITDPVAILGGLIPNPAQAQKIASLFPDQFAEDGLPEGCSMGSISTYAELNPESWSAKKHPNVIQYVDLSNTKFGIIKHIQSYSWYKAPSRAKRILIKGDTVIGTVRPDNGAYSLIHTSGLTASTGFAVLRPKEYDFRSFIYCAITRADNIAHLAFLADGGAYPAVTPEQVLDTQVSILHRSILDCFNNIANNLFDLYAHNTDQNHTLAEMRDLLLPKLMSGEISVDELEKKMGGVL